LSVGAQAVRIPYTRAPYNLVPAFAGMSGEMECLNSG
jgi:hypothetical protein